MADSLSNAAGVGVAMNIAGKEYRIKPLTVRDLAEFEGYVRSKRLRTFMEAAEGLPAAEKSEIIRSIVGNPPTGDDVSREMETLDGVRFLLWKTLAKTSVGMTLDEAGDLVTADNLGEVSTALQAVSGTNEVNPQGPPVASVTGGTSSSAS